MNPNPDQSTVEASVNLFNFLKENEDTEDELKSHYFQQKVIPQLLPVDASKMKEVLGKLDLLFELNNPSYFTTILGLFLGSSDHIEAIKEVVGLNPKPSQCGKSFTENDILWSCDDCAKLPNCTCYCNDCFERDKHKGHNYYFQLGNLGCCDCGDEASLKPESFCKVHLKISTPEADLALLSDYQRFYCPIVLEHLMRKLNEILVSVEPYNPDYQSCHKTLAILVFIMALYKLSPLYYLYLARCLMLRFNGFKTKHHCSATSKEESEHECTCNVLDNIVKILPKLFATVEISKFISEMAKINHSFGLHFLRSFWQNYRYLLDSSLGRQKNSQFFDNIMWQVIIIKEELIEIIPDYIETFLTCLESLNNEVFNLDDEVKQHTYSKCFQIFCDYIYFFNKEGILSDHLLSKTEFVERYVKCIEKLQYLGNIQQTNKFLLLDETGINVLLTRGINLLIEIFVYTLKPYRMNNESINKKIFKCIFQSILKDMKDENNKGRVNTMNIPLFNCFESLLVKLIYAHPFMNQEEIILLLKEYSDLDLKTVKQAIDYMLKKTLRVLGFITELMSGNWEFYKKSIEDLLNYIINTRPDVGINKIISLAQLLLWLQITDSINLLALFEDYMMIPLTDSSKSPLPHLQYKASPSEEEDKRKEDEDKALKGLKDKALTLCAQGMFMMGVCLWNDVAQVLSFLGVSIRGYKEKILPEFRAQIEYGLINEATNIVLKLGEKHLTMFSLENILEGYNSFIKVIEAESILKSYFKEVVSKKGQVGYKTGNAFLNHVNIFNMTSPRCFSNCELSLKELFKTQQCDIFEGKLTYSLIKRYRKDILTQIGKGSKEQLFKLMETSKSYLTQLIILRLIYDLAFIEDLSNEVKDMVRIYLEDLKEDSWEIYKPAIQKLKMKLLATLTESAAMEEAKLIKPAHRAKQRQEQILKEFEERQKRFNKKHSTDLNIVTSKESKEDTCSYCKETISVEGFESKPFIYLCYISSAGIHNKAYLNAFNNLSEKYPFIKLPKRKITKGFAISTCRHLIHYKCYQEYYLKNNLAILQVCPLCKSVFNNFLVYVPKPLKSMAGVCGGMIKGGEELTNEERLDVTLRRLKQYIKVTCQSVDLLPLHSRITSKQKLYKDYLNCVLCLVLDNEGYDPGKLNIEDEVSCLEKECIKSLIADILITIIKDTKTILKCKEFFDFYLNTFIYQALMKYLLLEHKGTLPVMQKDKLLKELYKVGKHNEKDINIEIVSFLAKLIFLKTIFEPLDYLDPSMDKMRNIISSSFEVNERIEKYCEVLELNKKPLEIILKEIEETIDKKSTKAGRVLKYFNQQFLNNKEYVPVVKFYMRTTPLSMSFFDLPDTYDKVISDIYTKNCNNCNENVRTKCICLVCGELVCAISDCCKRSYFKDGQIKTLGEVTLHTISCCVSSGLYLLMYEGTFIIQSEGLATQLSSCYTNSFGEYISKFCDPSALPYNSTDLNRYTLNMERYNQFKNLMLESGVISEIWRQRQNGAAILNEQI